MTSFLPSYRQRHAHAQKKPDAWQKAGINSNARYGLMHTAPQETRDFLDADATHGK